MAIVERKKIKEGYALFEQWRLLVDQLLFVLFRFLE